MMEYSIIEQVQNDRTFKVKRDENHGEFNVKNIHQECDCDKLPK